MSVDWLVERIASFGDRPALMGRDRSHSYGELADSIEGWRRVLDDLEVGPGAVVGPFAYLRPGADLGPGSKVGTFVEVKQSTIGPGSKVSHLTYAGDAEIGRGVNVGAGTVFVNRADYPAPDLAWTGWKDSGKGVTLSKFGFDQFVRLKSVHLKAYPGGEV